MRYKVVSFDLQGTLSDLAFSDEFWLELLPKLYSEKMNISVQEAKSDLKARFAQVGRYDYRYYSLDYWLDTFGLEKDWNVLLSRVKTSPFLYEDTKVIVKALKEKCPLLLFSATTTPFIQLELAEMNSAFTWIVSALDDLKTAGKPPEAFLHLSRMVNALPHEILHIGDDYQMDVENARKAGWNAFHIDRQKSREENMQNLLEILG